MTHVTFGGADFDVTEIRFHATIASESMPTIVQTAHVGAAYRAGQTIESWSDPFVNCSGLQLASAAYGMSTWTLDWTFTTGEQEFLAFYYKSRPDIGTVITYVVISRDSCKQSVWQVANKALVVTLDPQEGDIPNEFFQYTGSPAWLAQLLQTLS